MTIPHGEDYQEPNLRRAMAQFIWETRGTKARSFLL